jgi:hypothetical protein
VRTKSGTIVTDPRMARKLSRAKEQPKEVAPIVPLGADLYVSSSKQTAGRSRSPSAAQANQGKPEDALKRTYSIGSKLNFEMDDGDWIDADLIPTCMSCGLDISIEKFDVSGYLNKKRPGLRQLIAHDRWFCLIGSHLVYWINESDIAMKTPRGVLHLGDFMMEEEENDVGFSLIELDTQDRIALKYRDLDQKSKWMDALKNVKVLRK